MDYKYVYNEQGEKEAVIVPIDEWKQLVADRPSEEVKTVRMADMIGAAKGSFRNVREVDHYLEKLRNEWD